MHVMIQHPSHTTILKKHFLLFFGLISSLMGQRIGRLVIEEPLHAEVTDEVQVSVARGEVEAI